MAETKVLDKDLLAQLWTKCMNTFMQSGGASSGWLASEYEKTINLFNKFDTEYGAIYASSGVTSGDTSCKHSDYIEIEPSTIYTNNMVGSWSSGSGLAFYDSNKTYISGIKSSNSTYNQFTTPSNAKYVRISYYIESGTYFTDENTLMLVKGTTLPSSYIAYCGYNKITPQEATLLNNEYQKTVNLFNKNDILSGYEFNGTSLYPNSDWFVSGYIPVEPRKSYYLSGKSSGTSFITYDKNLNVVRGLAIPVGTYTANSDEYYIRFNSPLVDVNTIMFNEGTEPLPYTNYGGGVIAHKGDIEPVLLWENGSPTSNFAAQPITMAQDIINFNYLYIEVSLQSSSGQGNMIFKFRTKVSNNNYLTVFDNGSSATHSTRAFTITSTTNINVSACSNGNGYCIPLRIFGSNV